jgi:peroxiredoxin
VSADSEAKQAAFRREIGAPFSFVSDPSAALIKTFGVKMPLLKWAKRTTFVIGADRTIIDVVSGREAVDPSAAIAACPIF